MTSYVLVHAPLVGPLTWRPVADELRRRGQRAVVPSLLGRAWDGTPIWRQHVEAVVEAMGSLRAPVLVGHSGAGPLLPLIAERTEVAGAIFVDAFPSQRAPLADVLPTKPAPDGNGFVPAWADDTAMAPLIPDADLRRRCVAEMRGLPALYFREIVPPPRAGDVPCAYLLFSEVYRSAAEEMRVRGAAVREIHGGHFHMLVEPGLVTDAILGLARELHGPRPLAVAR